MLARALLVLSIVWATPGLAQTLTPPKQIAGSITDRDYPREAVRADISGITASRITIGTTGGVTSCSIVLASGSSILDSRACALISERFRFEPARDAEGRAIAAVRSQTIFWLSTRLMKIPYADQAFTVQSMPAGTRGVFAILNLLANTDGSIERCEIEVRTGVKSLDDVACKAMMAQPPLETVRSADGSPVRALHQLRVAFTGPRGVAPPK